MATKKALLHVTIPRDPMAIIDVLNQFKPGQYASVVFRKLDGTIRHLTFQTGNDAAYMVGSERGIKSAATFKKNNPYMIRLRDVHIAKRDGGMKAWRTIDATRVLAMRGNGVSIRVGN